MTVGELLEILRGYDEEVLVVVDYGGSVMPAEDASIFNGQLLID